MQSSETNHKTKNLQETFVRLVNITFSNPFYLKFHLTSALSLALFFEDTFRKLTCNNKTCDNNERKFQ